MQVETKTKPKSLLYEIAKTYYNIPSKQKTFFKNYSLMAPGSDNPKDKLGEHNVRKIFKI